MSRSAWALSLLAACGGGGPSGTCGAGLLAGDLVITEVMANPDGEDTGKEWFEVFNAQNAAVNVAGLELIASRSDGTEPQVHAVTALTLDPGAYVVFAGAANDLRPAYADYGYGGDLGALRNDAGRLALRCNGIIVDEITYLTPQEGAARAFTGSLIPDAVVNDDTMRWCDAADEYEPGNRGTPGERNGACTFTGGTMCDEGGTPRDIVFPTVGDVVISEIMPDPTKVADDQGEWLEVTIVNDVDLNGLELGTTVGRPRVTIEDSACRRRTAGTRVVFARQAMAAQNGGLPAIEETFSFGLSNSGGSLYVGVNGDVLDEVSWTQSTAGASIQLDRGKIDPVANDDAASWCPATAAYGLGDKGTPALENELCPIVVPPGMCLEGTTLRAIRTPAVGDLFITELLPNVTGVDTDKEWFEVYANAAVDLNGLQIGSTFPTVQKTYTSAPCLPADAGTYFLFLHNDGAGADPSGGLPRVDFRFTFDLVNSNRGVFLAVGGALLDAVTYTTVPEGSTRTLKMSQYGAATNDNASDDAAWCTATALYDGTNRGTPGAADPNCP